MWPSISRTTHADCPTCYNLVQDTVNEHRDKVAELARLLDNIEKNPQIVKSVDFEEKLEQVMTIVSGLWKDAKQASGESKQRGAPSACHLCKSN